MNGKQQKKLRKISIENVKFLIHKLISSNDNIWEFNDYNDGYWQALEDVEKALDKKHK